MFVTPFTRLANLSHNYGAHTARKHSGTELGRKRGLHIYEERSRHYEKACSVDTFKIEYLFYFKSHSF